MAREKNLEMSKASKGSQLETNKKAMSIQCKVFMQTFTCTTTEVKCKEHAEEREIPSQGQVPVIRTLQQMKERAANKRNCDKRALPPLAGY